MIIFIAGLVFGCVALIVGTLSWLYMRHRSNAAKIRRFGNEFKPEGTDSLNPDAMAEILERIARPLNKIAPPSVQDADKLQRLMLQAGYFSPRAPLVFRGIQLLAMGALPALTGIVLFLMEYSAGKVALGILISFAVGFFLPRYILGKMINGRQQRLTWGLADALDLMVVSMEAGLGINAAMVKVSEELADARPEISEEFALANIDIRIGRERSEALRNLSERTACDDLRNFVIMLIQADRFGTSIASAVRAYSDALRTQRRQRAEQSAQKAAVKLLLPLTCFLFPVLFIVILGPAAISLLDTLGTTTK